MLARMIGWLTISIAFLPLQAEDCCKNWIAVVESVTGQAKAQMPGAQNKVAVSALDLLPAGARIELSARSSAVIILSSGRRFELNQDAKAVVTAAALIESTGRIRELDRLPPIPKLEPIAGNAPEKAGATRFRNPSDVQDLYPRDATALPESLKLSFSSVADASIYNVILEDDSGDTLLNLRTPATSIDVPDALLKSGSRYSWRVRAIGQAGVIAEAKAGFVTISSEDFAQRRDFAGALKSTDEASRLALLGYIDLRLGLLAEARKELGAALRLKPGDAAIQRILDQATSTIEGRK